MKDQLDIYEENVASNYYLYLIETKLSLRLNNIDTSHAFNKLIIKVLQY